MSDVIDREPTAGGGGVEGPGRPTGGGGGGRGGGDRREPSARRFPVAAVSAGLVAVIVAVMFLVFATADPNTDETADTPLLGRPAPAVQGTTIDDGTFDLSRRRGSWVVLNFFQSTCVPCMREHPQLVRFAEQQAALGTSGAELYTIASPPDDDAAVHEFFETYGGGDWPIVRDYEGSIGVAFGVSKYPETWIIDPNGVVRERLISEITAAGLTSELAALQAVGGG